MPLPHNLKSPVDMMTPTPVGVCDRCGELRYLRDLAWQFQWQGNSLKNQRILVCYDRCVDVPSDFLRPAIIGPEPAPLPNARPWHYEQQNQGGEPPLNSTTEILPDV